MRVQGWCSGTVRGCMASLCPSGNHREAPQCVGSREPVSIPPPVCSGNFISRPIGFSQLPDKHLHLFLLPSPSSWRGQGFLSASHLRGISSSQTPSQGPHTLSWVCGQTSHLSPEEAGGG